MKKTILGISFLVMAAFAGNANAQCANDKCPDKDSCKKEICDKKNCNENDCKNAGCPTDYCRNNAEACATDSCDRKGPYCKMPYNRTGRGPQSVREESKCCVNAPYIEGLELSEDQKTKIQDLDNALQVSRKEMREANATQDKLPARSDRRADEIALRTKYLDDLKNILSPEQFSAFLQNFYINQTPGATPFKGGGRLDIRREKLEKLKMMEAQKEERIKNQKDSKENKDKKNDKKRK